MQGTANSEESLREYLMRPACHLPRGFTLIELMITVVILGVLASLGIYGVSKYRDHSKTTEARQLLGRLGKDHLTAFEGEHSEYAILPPTGTADIGRSLCPDAEARPVGIGSPSAPVSVPAIRAAKWQPGTGTFADDGWRCLKFSTTTPLYFGYGVDSNQAGELAEPGDAFVAYAIGDTDGDDEPSTLEYVGAVRASTNGTSMLVLATSIHQSRNE